ncbi:hypothetical protein QUC31_000568 [Theobroma cacao]|nr:CHCH - like 4 [Theobroma cacao]
MPRRNSAGRSAPRPAASAPSRNPPPQPAASAPPPAPGLSGSGSVAGGIGATIADGLAWGTGTAIAHRAVDSIFGPWVVKHETVASSEPAAAAPAPNMNSLANSDACDGQSKALSDCLSSYGSDISKCQFYMDMLQECRRSSGAALGAA